MHFQILAPAALLAGLASAAPTNSVTLFSSLRFTGDTVSWPIDGRCHNIAKQGHKLRVVSSVRIIGDVICHLWEDADCNGNHFDFGSPGVPELYMVRNWAKRAKALRCEKTPRDS